MPQFSIIIPVYRVEEYLEKCVDSILAQTCQDFELLLIDDGSPDGSGAICDRYAASHPNQVRALHQPNGGAGAARNRGIELAQGDYLLFVDGDDWLAPNLLEDLSASIAATPADLYLFGALVERDGKVTGELHEELPADLPTHTKDAPQLFFGVMAPWNRAYRRTLFTEGGIRFATKVWYEDIRIVTKVLALAEQVVRLPGAYYHYLQREGSAMNNKNCARNVEILYAFDDILGWFGEHGLREAYRDELTFLAISHLLIAASVRVARIDCNGEKLPRLPRKSLSAAPRPQQAPRLPPAAEAALPRCPAAVSHQGRPVIRTAKKSRFPRSRAESSAGFRGIVLYRIIRIRVTRRASSAPHRWPARSAGPEGHPPHAGPRDGRYPSSGTAPWKMPPRSGRPMP